MGISGRESFSGEGFHYFYIDRLPFLGTEYPVGGVLENMEVMVCIDLYLGGIWFCQIDIWCQLPLRCLQKLGYGFEKLGPEDGREMVTIIDTRRDSGVARARVWESTSSFPNVVTSSAPGLTPFPKQQNEAQCDVAGPCPHVL